MHLPRTVRAIGALSATLLLCPPALAGATSVPASLDALAERYVRLVLAIGEHDPDMVDAYYGPPAWREEARAHRRPLAQLDEDARALEAGLASPVAAGDTEQLRVRALAEQVAAVRTRIAVLRGERLPFDEEARRIYGVAPPRHDDAFYRAIAQDLDAALPGEGPIRERMASFRKSLIVPDAKVRDAMELGLETCRSATLPHIAMPEGESFRVEYVKDKPWAAYNWYRGDFHSLIEVNLDLPVHAFRVAGLMCHEGYPGHHVLNSLLDQELLKRRGWVEYSVYPLFSPQSLLAEGTANYGQQLVFPGDSRWHWERDRLYPLAGIDPSLAGRQEKVRRLTEALAYARIDAARAYLDGQRTADETVAWLREFTFVTEEEARQGVEFFDRYRSYIVNYRLGEDLVREHVDRAGGDDAGRRWAAFRELLVAPPVVSRLVEGTSLEPRP